MDRSFSSRQTLLAIGSSFLAAFSLSSMDTVMKGLMANGVSPWFAQGVRGWLIVVGILIIMHFQGKRDYRLVRPRAWIMWLRGISMFAGSMMIFVAVSKIELATVATMIFLYPLLVGLLGAVFLGETIGPRRIVFILVGFVGVVIAAGFSPTTFEVWALLPAGAAILISTQAISVRWAPADMSNLELTFLTVVPMALCGTPFLVTQFPPVLTAEIVAGLALVGVLATSGTLCLSFAFKNAPLGLVGSLNYSSVIFSALLAWLFFAEVPSDRVFLAMALIIGAGVGYMYFQHRAEVAKSKI